MAHTMSERGPKPESKPGIGRLTTHVLDTSLGRPASDLGVALYRIGEDGTHSLVVETRTNDDGRCDKPLLSGADFVFGRYELVFSAGPYLARTAPSPVEPAFLDEVVIRFGLAEDAHYHVPLLLSPFAYSTYRGS